MAGLLRRMMHAALLDREIYEEVEADRGANLQALFVVLLSSAAAGIGSLENNGVQGIFIIMVASLVTWWSWAWLTYAIGTKILPRPETVADHGELLRTLGFSSSPGVLLVLALIAPIAPLIFPLCMIWMLVAMVIGVRQALDYEGPGATGRAIAVCAIGFPVYAIGLTTMLLVLGPWPI